MLKFWWIYASWPHKRRESRNLENVYTHNLINIQSQFKKYNIVTSTSFIFSKKSILVYLRF